MKTRRGINYRWDGNENAPVLIFSNSLGTDLSMWDAQVEFLQNDFHILRYDTRGHGQSFYWEEGLTIEDLGFDVIQMMDELEVEHAHYCGISLGGFTGLWLGHHQGPRLQSLTLANTSPRIATPEIWQQRIDLVKKEGLVAVAAASASRWFTPEFIKKNTTVVEALVANLVVTASPQGYIACCEVLRDNNLWNLIPDIHCPSLILAGEFDPVTTVAEAYDMQAQLPKSQLRTLKASHLSNIESAEFSMELSHFLTGL